MALYRDLLTNDELLSSYFDTKEIDNTVYEAEGRMKTKVGENNFDIGANASAEDAGDEGVDDPTSEQVIDVVDNFRLQKMEGLFPTKKEFAAHIKGYLGTLGAGLRQHGKSEEDIKQIQNDIKTFCGKVVKDFKQFEFYSGESMDIEKGQVVMCQWKDNKNGDEAPFFYVFSKACKVEKI